MGERELEPPSPEQSEPLRPDPSKRERDLIDILTTAVPCPESAARVGPGDDGAVLPDGATITVDALVEGVHWNERLSPADVGYKAIAVSASDLGAMGARPAWMVLALGLSSAEPAWVEQLAEGLGAAARRFGVALVGGDVVRSPVRTVSLTMGGPAVATVLRSTGRPGDRLWVTGTLGTAGAGYLLPDPPAACLAALRRPAPPVEFALAAAAAGLPSAAMDLSDGLATDLPRLCRASGAGARVEPGALPLHPALEALGDPLSLQVDAGEDYQLLLAAPPTADDALAALAERHGVCLTRIGALTARGPARLAGRDWPSGAYAHFDEAAR